MKFTIITVCLNASLTISTVIETVRRQNYDDFEHLILDGGSSDGTLRTIEERAHPRLTHTSEPDRGIYDAMNKGVLRATGDVLIFLNADDGFASDDVLRTVSDVFRERPCLDLVYGDVEGILRGEVKLLPQPRTLDRRTLARTTICHQALFAKRKLFDEIGNFRLEYPVVADWDWLYRALLCEKKQIAFVPVIVARIGMEGVSHQTDFWPEKQRALRQYYLDPEIRLYRIMPIWIRQRKRRLKRLLRPAVGLAKRVKNKIMRALVLSSDTASRF